MDPRIRQRRIDVVRQEGRRRLRLLGCLVGVLALAAAGLALTHSAALAVHRVEVTGAVRTTTAEVLARARLDRRQLMIDVDPRSVGRRVSALAWVRRARVERHWPGTVRITVTERSPEAVVAGPAGTTAVVDGQGRVLESVTGNPPGRPRLEGVGDAPAPGASLGGAGRDALAVVLALPAPLRAQVASVTVVGGGELEVTLAVPRAVIVRVGPADGLAAKMLALTTVLARVDMDGVTAIDVRAPEAPTVARGATISAAVAGTSPANAKPTTGTPAGSPSSNGAGTRSATPKSAARSGPASTGPASSGPARSGPARSGPASSGPNGGRPPGPVQPESGKGLTPTTSRG